MDKWKTENETARLIGVSRQTLRVWRLGLIKGKYQYKPRLIEGVDWVKIGRSVMFTDAFFNKYNKEN